MAKMSRAKREAEIKIVVKSIEGYTDILVHNIKMRRHDVAEYIDKLVDTFAEIEAPDLPVPEFLEVMILSKERLIEAAEEVDNQYVIDKMHADYLRKLE